MNLFLTFVYFGGQDISPSGHTTSATAFVERISTTILDGSVKRGVTAFNLSKYPSPTSCDGTVALTLHRRSRVCIDKRLVRNRWLPNLQARERRFVDVRLRRRGKGADSHTRSAVGIS